jgi:uncharacterized protein YccT (UPF0319 family)
MSSDPILVRVAPEFIEHLSVDGSEPVVILGLVRYDDGAYDLVMRSRPDVSALRRALQEAISTMKRQMMSDMADAIRMAEDALRDG